MQRYNEVFVIFNPKSTGYSQAKAEAFSRTLREELPEAEVKLIATKYQGHAEELAYELSLAASKPLIISASGDGGYNEVVNGVMRAQTEGAAVTTGILPTGNANDHYHSVGRNKEAQTLRKHVRHIDLIKVTTKHKGDTWQRYAHSYVGIGITATVSKKLNQITLNRVNEWVVAARMIYNSPPVEVIVKGKPHRYDSLIFSNIGRLAKVFILSSTSAIDDGKFEVIALESKTKAAMVRSVAKALTTPAEEVADVSSVSSFRFKTTDKLTMQLDGEIITLKPDTTVTVESIPRVLGCII
jgi:diacylglycerol kinase (ATP)